MTDIYEGRGFQALEDAPSGSGDYFALKDGESADVRILTKGEELLSVYVHKEQDLGGKWHTLRCLGSKQCPLCKAGKRPVFRTYGVVFDRTDNKQKIWDMSQTIFKELENFYKEYGSINDRDYKVTRTGTKFDTVYRFIPRDKTQFQWDEAKLNPEDLISCEQEVAPKTPEAINTILRGDAPEGPVGGTGGISNVQDTPGDFPF